MSFYEYEEGKVIAAKEPSFYALIQAAMRRADTNNLEMLKGCWPETWAELFARYHSPDGKLEGELKGDEK
jgi:hypothetical protein